MYGESRWRCVGGKEGDVDVGRDRGEAIEKKNVESRRIDRESEDDEGIKSGANREG